MTEEELEELIIECPTLYHMAEHGSWASIREHGLLSTSALLDVYAIQGDQRNFIERQHRPRTVKLRQDGLPGAFVRDQSPMSDSGLRQCLPSRLTPADWYQLLNAKAFFWLNECRLHKLTGAKVYRDREHDVLEVDTRSLVTAHRKSIWLCPINSGCTRPMPSPRDETAFQRIPDYPYAYWRKKRSKRKRVAELAVDYSVPDIRNHIKRVVVMQGDTVIRVIE